MSSRTRLGLIHTSATLVPVFARLCEEKIPAVEVFNICDDSLVRGILEAGSITSGIERRVRCYIESAALAGASHVLVTCSSIGPAVEAAAPLVDVPVLRVDQPMADLAVSRHERIGVIATLRTTLEPTTDLIRRRAERLGRTVELTARLAEGAFEALLAGDAAGHDRLVAAALGELAEKVDVIVLAQASMARVVDALAAEDRTVPVPILSSPGLAVDHLAAVFGAG